MTDIRSLEQTLLDNLPWNKARIKCVTRFLLALYAVLQLGRIWVIASLGRHWTTRLIVPADRPLVNRGPYRFFNHPNYLIVIAEIAVLPLAFGAAVIAAVFSAATLALLARRVAIEERALAPRRGI